MRSKLCRLHHNPHKPSLFVLLCGLTLIHSNRKRGSWSLGDEDEWWFYNLSALIFKGPKLLHIGTNKSIIFLLFYCLTNKTMWILFLLVQFRNWNRNENSSLLSDVVRWLFLSTYPCEGIWFSLQTMRSRKYFPTFQISLENK